MNCLGIKSKFTRRTKTVTNGINTKSTELFQDVPVAFAEATEQMEFLVIDGVQVDVLIGLTKLEQLQAIIDLGGQSVDPKFGEKPFKLT